MAADVKSYSSHLTLGEIDPIKHARVWWVWISDLSAQKTRIDAPFMHVYHVVGRCDMFSLKRSVLESRNPQWKLPLMLKSKQVFLCVCEFYSNIFNIFKESY